MLCSHESFCYCYCLVVSVVRVAELFVLFMYVLRAWNLRLGALIWLGKIVKRQDVIRRSTGGDRYPWRSGKRETTPNAVTVTTRMTPALVRAAMSLSLMFVYLLGAKSTADNEIQQCHQTRQVLLAVLPLIQGSAETALASSSHACRKAQGPQKRVHCRQ